eukprot:252248-Rhodomonas_salina.4
MPLRSRLYRVRIASTCPACSATTDVSPANLTAKCARWQRQGYPAAEGRELACSRRAPAQGFLDGGEAPPRPADPLPRVDHALLLLRHVSGPDQQPARVAQPRVLRQVAQRREALLDQLLVPLARRQVHHVHRLETARAKILPALERIEDGGCAILAQTLVRQVFDDGQRGCNLKPDVESFQQRTILSSQNDLREDVLSMLLFVQ